MAAHFDGQNLNSPTDMICQRSRPGTGSLWFTDPSFGIHGWWEGEPAQPERPHGVHRIDAASSGIDCVLDNLNGPNGLAF